MSPIFFTNTLWYSFVRLFKSYTPKFFCRPDPGVFVTVNF